MNKLVYFGLLVLVAVVSAEELKQGDCDPVAQAEVIRGCDSACGNNTCKLNGKPYCACEKAPAYKTSDVKYECFTHVDDMEEIFPGEAYIGQECRDRCPADPEVNTYYCDEVEGDSLVCVCAPTRFPSSSTESLDTMTGGQTRVGAAVDVDLDGLLDLLFGVLRPLVDKVLSTLQQLLNKVNSGVCSALPGLIQTLQEIADKLLEASS